MELLSTKAKIMQKAERKHFVTVVMPCLNEEEAVGHCVREAIMTLKKHKITSEVIVVDNGSKDRSVMFAKKSGAKVVQEKYPGYGSAYIAGLSKAKGDIIIMGDSDGTYDFTQIPDFLAKITDGYEFVNGSRIKGNIAPGAFRFSHRYLAVPFLTGMLNLFFGTKFSDAHCGMRAFTQKAYKSMKLRCRGMEFASEMIMKASSLNLKSTEIPINYFPRVGSSKLLRFRDAWRHIRFMLIFAPTFLFILPGLFLLFFGLVSLFLMLPGPFWLWGHGFDIHAMMFSLVISILGMNILLLGLFVKMFALFGNIKLVKNPWIKFFIEKIKQEDWLKFGLLLFFIGFIVSLYVFYLWIIASFGSIFQIRPLIIAVTFMILGVQIIFASFFVSLMIDRYKKLI